MKLPIKRVVKIDSQPELDTVRSSFRDPDLQLITSARPVALEQVSQFAGQDYVLHRLIFTKDFPTLLKVFRSSKKGLP